jgi:hypothetical protein
VRCERVRICVLRWFGVAATAGRARSGKAHFLPMRNVRSSMYFPAQRKDDPTMRPTPHASAHPSSAHETAQTVLLIIVTVVGTWLAVYGVPWQVSGDPCLVAAAATAVIVICLWVTRWRGLRGATVERNLLAGFLVIMPLVYVARYLFAFRGREAGYWLWVEVLGTILFVTLAVLGVKRSPWFLAIGMMLHGLAWDAWHYQNSTYIPDWYVIACLAVDLSVGAYMAARVPVIRGHPVLRRSSNHTTVWGGMSLARVLVVQRRESFSLQGRCPTFRFPPSA